MVARLKRIPRTGSGTTLVSADLHFSDNPRDAYRFHFLEGTLPRLIHEHNVQNVLLLGDLTEAKDSHKSTLVNRMVDGIAALARLADVYVLKGNHDYVTEDTPFYRFLDHIPNVRWINEPEAWTLPGLGECLFLPHTHNLGDWANFMFDPFDWFFCHQTFQGADLGHGIKAESAAAPFTANSRVLSGDVHVPQKLGCVTYVGSPYAVDFGDTTDTRVILLDGNNMQSISVDVPQKRLVTLRGRDPLRALNMDHPFEAMLSPLRPGDVVKVRVELPPKSELTRAAVRAEVRAWAEEAGIHLYAVEIKTPNADAEIAREKKPQRNDEELVRAYAQKMKKGEATVAAGMKIVEESP